MDINVIKEFMQAYRELKKDLSSKDFGLVSRCLGFGLMCYLLLTGVAAIISAF